MKKFYYLSPLILQTLIWIPTRIYFRLFYSYSIKGLENLKNIKQKDKRGVIFAVNHSSELDPIMIPASLPFLSKLMPMFYVSREQKFYSNSGWRQHIYGGRFFNFWGAYTAYTGLKNYELSLRHHIKILEDGRSLCIFPEGKKTRDGSIGEGKAGVSFLAHKTNSIIVPTKINGLFKPLAKKDKLGRTRLGVIFGEPLFSENLFQEKREISINEFKEIRGIIMQKIRDLE